jgi:hypothetical protein
MEIAFLVCAIAAVIALWSASGTLKRIEHHNARFVPPDAGAPVELGDLVRFRSFGHDQVCRVVELAADAVVVEPLGSGHTPEAL